MESHQLKTGATDNDTHGFQSGEKLALLAFAEAWKGGGKRIRREIVLPDNPIHRPIEARRNGGGFVGLAQHPESAVTQHGKFPTGHAIGRVAKRRAREIDEGQVELVPSEELERRVQARLK